MTDHDTAAVLTEAERDLLIGAIADGREADSVTKHGPAVDHPLLTRVLRAECVRFVEHVAPAVERILATRLAACGHRDGDRQDLCRCYSCVRLQGVNAQAAAQTPQTSVECGGCGGTGNIGDIPGCPDCYGTGRVPVDPQPDEREALGRLVREVWVGWAREQPNPKASWLVGWDDLPEPDREVDRRIGEALYARGRRDPDAGLREAVLAALVHTDPSQVQVRVGGSRSSFLDGEAAMAHRVRAALAERTPGSES